MVMTSPLLGLFDGKEDSKELLNSLTKWTRQTNARSNFTGKMWSKVTGTEECIILFSLLMCLKIFTICK